MEFKIIQKTCRSFTAELVNQDIYFSKESYNVYLNGACVIENETKNVFSVYGLNPNTEYEVAIGIEKEMHAAHKFTTDTELVRLNVKKFGAVGDGEADDTSMLQATILACPDHGTVYIPEGTYLTGPLFLKSHITIELDENAILLGTTDRNKYPILPGYTLHTDEQDEYYLGSWEGNPLTSMASLITGINVEDVRIIGKGTLEGNAHNGDWWIDVKNKKRAWRPRMLFLNNCKNIVLQGVRVQNSPSWTMHPYFSEDIKFLDMEITNPYNSHNTDGIDPESCTNVDIIGVKISVGDDCIAIKSGKLFMGKKFKKPSENFTIRNCIMEKGHGSVVVGSEIAGGVRNINVSQCLFRETDRGLRIKTRRGRGKDSILDQIHFSNIEMDGVLTPFVINMYYFCDPDGKSEYVWSKEALPVDDMTPAIKQLTFTDIVCHNAEVAASFFYGLPESPIEEVKLENIRFDFKEDAKAGEPAMMSYLDPVKKMGIFARHVNKLTLDNVKLAGFEGKEKDIESVACVIEK
ncbi:MAG: glycoside hydrolase family 28 protein [Cellulosilyticum sp.]|nr:glycoside hydrolase family 28 protein [Cellulosilyticum sp.]